MKLGFSSTYNSNNNNDNNNNNYDDVRMVYLDQYLPHRDERSAELCDEQAANEEIPQPSSEKLKIRHIAQSAVSDSLSRRTNPIYTQQA